MQMYCKFIPRPHAMVPIITDCHAIYDIHLIKVLSLGRPEINTFRIVEIVEAREPIGLGNRLNV